jgi:hypothetical protein
VATDQPLAANVAPFSNPPSPEGEIKVVCAAKYPETSTVLPTKTQTSENALASIDFFMRKDDYIRLQKDNGMPMQPHADTPLYFY